MAAIFTNLQAQTRAEDAALGALGADAAPAQVAAIIADRSTVPDYVLLFTIIMGSAFIGELFPTHVADLIRRNTWAKHLMALALLVVTIVWVRADMSVPLLIGYTAATYAWYLALTSMEAPEFMTVIVLLFVVFAASHARRAAARRTLLQPSSASEGASEGASKGASEGASKDKDTDTRTNKGKSKSKSKSDDWRYWLEVGALTGAASLTVWFTSTHLLQTWMAGH